MCTDETSDGVMANGRSETVNHHNAVASCNSNDAAMSDMHTCDPEV